METPQTERETSQVKEEFLAKLRALLQEYDAEISIQEYDSFSYTPTPFIEVFIPSKWEKDGGFIYEGGTIDLGKFVNKSE